MKKLLLFVLSTMFLISAAMGQENYQKGVVVNLTGDTLQGFINYHSWGINPRKIDFKTTLNGKKIFYRPLNIKAFYVEGESYISAIVKSETSSRTQLNFVGDSSTIRTRTDTAFLRILANGHPKLLFYKNGLNIENFYLEKDGQIHLLGYKKYMVQDTDGYLNTKTFIKENKKYIGQLMVYMQDCPKIKSQIGYADYNRQSLIKLFKNYYKCKHENVAQVVRVEKTKVKFGVVAGLMNSKITFSGAGYAAPKVDFSSSMNFTAGIMIDVVMPRNLNEWSVHNEIAYTSMLTTGTNGVSDMKFGYSAITLTDMARFTFPLGKKVSVFLNAGISGGYVLSYTNQIKYNQVVVGESLNTFPKNSLRNLNFAWVVGGGLRMKNITLEVRGDWRTGYSKIIDKAIGVKQLIFLVGYSF